MCANEAARAPLTTGPGAKGEAGGTAKLGRAPARAQQGWRLFEGWTTLEVRLFQLDHSARLKLSTRRKRTRERAETLLWHIRCPQDFVLRASRDQRRVWRRRYWEAGRELLRRGEEPAWVWEAV